MNLFYYSCEEDAIIFGIVFVKKATQRKMELTPKGKTNIKTPSLNSCKMKLTEVYFYGQKNFLSSRSKRRSYKNEA